MPSRPCATRSSRPRWARCPASGSRSPGKRPAPRTSTPSWVSVPVIERQPEAVRPSRALILHARTLKVLRPLGVTQALLARADIAPTASNSGADRWTSHARTPRATVTVIPPISATGTVKVPAQGAKSWALRPRPTSTGRVTFGPGDVRVWPPRRDAVPQWWWAPAVAGLSGGRSTAARPLATRPPRRSAADGREPDARAFRTPAVPAMTRDRSRRRRRRRRRRYRGDRAGDG